MTCNEGLGKYIRISLLWMAPGLQTLTRQSECQSEPQVSEKLIQVNLGCGLSRNWSNFWAPPTFLASWHFVDVPRSSLVCIVSKLRCIKRQCGRPFSTWSWLNAMHAEGDLKVESSTGDRGYESKKWIAGYLAPVCQFNQEESWAFLLHMFRSRHVRFSTCMKFMGSAEIWAKSDSPGRFERHKRVLEAYLAKNRLSAMVSSSEPSESPPKRQGLHERRGRGSNRKPLYKGWRSLSYSEYLDISDILRCGF